MTQRDRDRLVVLKKALKKLIKHQSESRAGAHNGNSAAGTLVFKILARRQRQLERQQVFRK